MSDYTITLKRICDVYGKDEVISWFKDYTLFDYLTNEQVIQITKNGVFNNATLANMILNHYYFREIAFETPEMFHHYTSIKLKEIMGKYAPLIYSASLSFNPLEIKTMDIKETFQRNKETSNNGSETKNGTSETTDLTNNLTSTNGSSQTTGDSNSSSYNNASSLNVSSDTPQGQISKAEILQGKWASSTSANESNSEVQDFTHSTSDNYLTNREQKNGKEKISGSTSSQNSSSNTGAEAESYERNKTGYDYKITKSKLLEEYRNTIINIYERIIEDLNSLFFALF